MMEKDQVVQLVLNLRSKIDLAKAIEMHSIAIDVSDLETLLDEFAGTIRRKPHAEHN